MKVKLSGGKSGSVDQVGDSVRYVGHKTPEHHVYGKASTVGKAVRSMEQAVSPKMLARPPVRSRDEMPQIPAAKQHEFESFLAKNGVAVRQITISPKLLAPTQKDFNQLKVDKMRLTKAYKNKPISVSSDRRILDGHHSWQAALQAKDRRVTVNQYSVKMPTLIKLADQFAKEQGIPARKITELGLIAACYSAACRPPTSGGTGGSGSKARHASESSPHYQTRSGESVMPMSETEATALVRDKDATGRRVLDKGKAVDDGQVVGVRANLNLKKTTGITIQTMHDGTEAQLKKGTGLFAGEAIGYQSAVTLKDVNFSVNQTARAAIAEKRQNKFPMASVDGHYVANPDQGSRFDGIEVRFNPMTSHTFVDPDGRAVKSASEVTVVGGSVFVRGTIEYFTPSNMPENVSTVPSSAKPWGE